MTDTCINCLNKEELRAMMNEVAEHAAKTAAKEVALELKLEIAELKAELKREFADELDSKLGTFMGMTPHEHAIEHDRMRQVVSFYSQLSDGFKKKLIAALIAVTFAVGVGYNAADIKAIVNQKPDPVKERKHDDVE